MTPRATACDLCGLPLPAKPFRATAGKHERLFCCEGCRAIWQMLNEDGGAEMDKGAADDQRGTIT